MYGNLRKQRKPTRFAGKERVYFQDILGCDIWTKLVLTPPRIPKRLT
jgi:hypothetical protein